MKQTTIGKPSSLRHVALAVSLVALLGACTTAPQTTPTTVDATTTPAPPVPVLPFDAAVLKAANDLFSKAQLPPATAGSPVKYALVIDPLVDGVSGNQSTATESMQTRIAQLVREKYPQFDIQPFTKAAVEKAPIVLVGTFTPVNKEGKTEGTREAYRICLALADFKSGKVVSKGTARAQMQGVDATPTAYFRDSPAWAKEAATEGYIKTCQGTKPGDPINPVYIERITAAVLINEAIEAYNAARYEEALEYYTNALHTPGGDQLRAHNGIYMSNWQLGRYDAAAESFGQIVDYGITNKRLAVKFLFKPRSTAFWPDQRVTKPYPIWLKQIARHAVQRDACLEISGHTSPTGPEPLNERLSLRRAEYIQKRLEAQAPALRGRTLTDGKGSRENLVGTGKDDVTDALDRRVVFVVIDCAGRTAVAPVKTAAVTGY